MGRNDGGDGTSTPTAAVPECCMCGDRGLSSELFRCSDCQFRSQHKYCSNLYPEADSYETCNWCLGKKGLVKPGSNGTTLDSSNSSSSQHQIYTTNQDSIKIKNKKRLVKKTNNHHEGLKEIRRDNYNQIMTEKLEDDFSKDRRSQPSVGRKRITLHGGSIAERVRTRSEHRLSSNGGKMMKQVLRNKVIRRYKFLDEVSSQPVNANI